MITKYGLHFVFRNQFSAETLATLLATNQRILKCLDKIALIKSSGRITKLFFRLLVVLSDVLLAS